MVGDLERAAGRISLEGVFKAFLTSGGEELQVLEDIDLNIEPGEPIAIIGPSGCGKTTILRLIAGLETASSGVVTVDGRPIRGPDRSRAFMSQDPNLFPWLTARKNIAFGLEARQRRERIDKTDIDRRVRALVGMVGLMGFEDAYPHQLSGGMVQRVALARALANEPKVLLLDEPFASLDAFTRMALQDQLIRIWQSRKCSIVLVTHDIDEAVNISHRVAIMSTSPARITGTLDIPLDRPRDRTDVDFLRIRQRIYAEFRPQAPRTFTYQI